MEMKILVADDTRSYALLFKKALEARGHEVTVTSDGRECIYEYIEEFKRIQKSHEKKIPFDLVILDHKMPRMTGLSVAKEILDLVPSQRVMIVTAFSSEIINDIDKVDGFIEILNKPFPSIAMIKQVEGLENLRWNNKKKTKLELEKEKR